MIQAARRDVALRFPVTLGNLPDDLPEYRTREDVRCSSVVIVRWLNLPCLPRLVPHFVLVNCFYINELLDSSAKFTASAKPSDNLTKNKMLTQQRR